MRRSWKTSKFFFASVSFLSILLLLSLPSIGFTGPKKLEVFDPPGKDPTKHVVPATEKDFWFIDQDRKPYTECWYYLAVAENGTIFFCHFTLLRINWLINEYTLDFGLTLPDGKSLFFANGFKKSQVKFATDRFEVKVGPNWVKGPIAEQKLHIEELGYIIDLAFKEQVQPFREGNGKIYLDKAKDNYLDITFEPAMRFEGTIETEGKKQPIKGWAYRDHVRQTFIATDFAKQLRAFRVNLGELFISALEYYPIPEFTPNRVPVLIVTYKNKLLHLSNSYDFTTTAEYKDPKTATKVPRSFKLTDQEGAFHLECSTNGKLLQRIDYLESVNALLKKALKWAGIRSYGYVFEEEAKCKIDSPEISGTYSGKGVLEVLDSE